MDKNESFQDDMKVVQDVTNMLNQAINGIQSARLCTFNKEVIQTADYNRVESTIVISFESGRRLILSALRDDLGNPQLDFSS